MDKKAFKNSFLGYSKTSVCEYIARINEEFSRKFLSTIAEHEQIQKELREKIAQVEKENEQLRSRQNEVTAILLDTKSFAAELNDKAKAENNRMTAENTKRRMAELERIRSYGKRIDSIRDEIGNLLQVIDAELSQNRDRISALEDEEINHDETPDSKSKAEIDLPFDSGMNR